MYQIQHDNVILGTGETLDQAVMQLKSKVDVVQEGDTLRAYLCDPMFKEKKVFLQGYTTEWTYWQIVRDCAQKICRMHGYTIYRVQEY